MHPVTLLADQLGIPFFGIATARCTPNEIPSTETKVHQLGWLTFAIQAQNRVIAALIEPDPPAASRHYR
jgi:hypothetical protein